eukprot:CAMPEP_0185836610 /NCGR_PEP_ID=MMETSP1353-20130828/10024_1 /TAXON_ID=1077150 /ORGANISM="Erythrolobus australicus, Strain CCMP3124" /LENGTH=93 /DNA_ID=CAMNT_0028535417 /DNA_START=332 /DNA_END=610 /DNA_ORIENTATION=+
MGYAIGLRGEYLLLARGRLLDDSPKLRLVGSALRSLLRAAETSLRAERGGQPAPSVRTAGQKHAVVTESRPTPSAIPNRVVICPHRARLHTPS